MNTQAQTTTDDVTDQEIAEHDRLMRLGWEAVSGKGAQWAQQVAKKELTIQEAITLATGQLQGACYVLKMFLRSVSPEQAKNDIAEEIASSAFTDIMSVQTFEERKQQNAEQRDKDEDTAKTDEEEVQEPRDHTDVRPNDEANAVGDDQDV